MRQSLPTRQRTGLTADFAFVSPMMMPPKLSDDLVAAVTERLHACLDKARDHFNTPFPLPTVSYLLRGSRAGTAHLLTWEIRLNPVLLQENQQDFIDAVVPHELAHLLVYRQFGRVKPHGPAWQWMMTSVLGVTARRTHNFDTQSVIGPVREYQCQCRVHPLSIRRHNKVQRQQCHYYCRCCKQRLVLKSRGRLRD